MRATLGYAHPHLEAVLGKKFTHFGVGQHNCLWEFGSSSIGDVLHSVLLVDQFFHHVAEFHCFVHSAFQTALAPPLGRFAWVPLRDLLLSCFWILLSIFVLAPHFGLVNPPLLRILVGDVPGFAPDSLIDAEHLVQFLVDDQSLYGFGRRLGQHFSGDGVVVEVAEEIDVAAFGVDDAFEHGGTVGQLALEVVVLLGPVGLLHCLAETFVEDRFEGGVVDFLQEFLLLARHFLLELVN